MTTELTRHRATIVVDILAPDLEEARSYAKALKQGMVGLKEPRRGKPRIVIDYTDLVEIKEVR